MNKWKDSTSFPFRFACIVACAHAVIIGLLISSLSDKGSWGAVLPFAIDFPISILFVWLVNFLPLSLLHLVIGSAWWGLLGWIFAKILLLLKRLINQMGQ